MYCMALFISCIKSYCVTLEVSFLVLFRHLAIHHQSNTAPAGSCSSPASA